MNNEKNLGHKTDRPDNIPDADLRSQLADAVTSGDHDRVFGLAAAYLATVPANSPKMLSLQTVAETLGLSPRTIWRLLADAEEKFPRPVHVGQQCRWLADGVDTYIEKLKATGTKVG